DLGDATIGNARGDLPRLGLTLHEHVDRACRCRTRAVAVVAAATSIGLLPALPLPAVRGALPTRSTARRHPFGPEAQRRVRHGEHPVAAIGYDTHGRRHAGLELEVVVGH